MNRIGKRPKKGAAAGAAAEDPTAAKKGLGAADYQKGNDKLSGGGGFSEKDIEFMKKAIQVLC